MRDDQDDRPDLVDDDDDLGLGFTPNCKWCLVPLDAVGDDGSARWECPSCGLVRL